MLAPKTTKQNKSRGTRRAILKGAAGMLCGIFCIVLVGLANEDVANRAVLMFGIISLIGGCAVTVIITYMSAAAHEDKGSEVEPDPIPEEKCEEITVSVKKHSHTSWEDEL